MNRRELIKSLIGTSVTILGGITAFQFYQQALLEYPHILSEKEFTTFFLNSEDRLVLAVFIPVMVGQLKVDPDLKLSILNIDNAIIRLPYRTQTELRELFDLLGSGIGRLLLAGVWLNWQKAGSKEVISFLSDWRESHLALLQQAYVGLHQLIIGSVYAESEHWQAIGYPGPLKLS